MIQYWFGEVRGEKEQVKDSEEIDSSLADLHREAMNKEMRPKVAIAAIGKRKDCRCLERPLVIQAQSESGIAAR